MLLHRCTWVLSLTLLQDLAYKDIIEPLESVSVSLTPTDKKTIQEFGGIAEVLLLDGAVAMKAEASS